ncbi:pilus assembly protein PilB [Lysinibacillus sp. FSL K6-0232]|uniref:pilus assembly protein PilB n=1 Tax=unclassified Lysinibacillus TaxID=2636778 RepID=UPI0030F93B0A
MEKNYKAKMLLFPIIVTFITVLSIHFIEGLLESEQMYLRLAMLIMLFLAIYLFTAFLVVPINIYLSEKLGNRFVSFMLFNSIGFILIGCMDIWFLTLMDLKSLYLIFPLFSILTIPFLKRD